MIMLNLFLPFLFLMTCNSPKTFASGDHENEIEEHHEERFGDQKALTDVDAEKGFKLSPESIKIMGIETKDIDANNPQIPKSSFVSIKDKKGIYIVRNSYFKFVELTSLNNLMSGDKLVTKGMGIIAITDIFSTDDTEYSH